jgi:hypothetical protein
VYALAGSHKRWGEFDGYEAPDEVPELFMEKWLAEEANEANGIKNNTPVMVVLGNPQIS